jgi:electron transfer flavoprotein beta subunit
VRIVVLVKPVPDPASGAERLGPDSRLDRAAAPAVVNGNDEYALEAALKLIEEHGGEVTLVSMAPPNAPDTMRKALAMGAQSGVHVTDPALEGSDTLSTARVLAAALEPLEFDLVLAGVDTSDGVAGVVPAGVAALRRLPYLSYAAKIEPDPGAGTVRVRRISATGFDVLEAPMPALISCTQALGEPRYPSLKGIMAARSRTIETRALGDLGVDGTGVGGDVATTAVVDSTPPEARGATRVVRDPPDEAARQLVDFLAERRLLKGSN